MAKLVLNALLRRHQEGVQAEVAEVPDIKVSASASAALSLDCGRRCGEECVGSR